QLALMRGAGRVVVVDGNPTRLKVAIHLGCDAAINYREAGDSLLEAVHDALGGRGADVVFDCAGTPQAARQCFDLVRTRGTVVIIGSQHAQKEVAFDLMHWERKAHKIVVTRDVRPHMLRDLMMRAERTLAGGRFDADARVTH